MKYELTDCDVPGMFRIRALREIPRYGVRSGDSGGLIAHRANLAQDGNAWVSSNAWVYGDARVWGNAQVWGNACITAVCVTALRSDGYTFTLLPCKDGIYRVFAESNYFTLDEATEHWTRTRGGTRLGDESLAIIALFRISASA